MTANEADEEIENCRAVLCIARREESIMGKRSASIVAVTAVIALILIADSPPRSAPSTVAARVTREHYGQLPLSFEPNQGQTDSRVKFISRSNGATMFLT